MRTILAKLLLKLLNWSIKDVKLTRAELKEVNYLKAKLSKYIPYSKRL